MLHNPIQWPIFGALVVLSTWALILVGRHLRERNRIRELELTHKGRMEAMERGLTLPAVGELSKGSTIVPENTEKAVYWLRTVSLAFGLLLLFAGIGMVVAFNVLPDFEDIWAVGYIPAMAGVGLILFHILSRRIPVPPSREGESR